MQVKEIGYNMRKKIVAIVVVMISLCSCFIFSDTLTADKVISVFASMYGPTSGDETRTVMNFNSEAGIYPEIPTNQFAENNINAVQTTNKITGVTAYK